MRDIIEKFIRMGLSVVFSEEAGYSVIRLYKGDNHTVAVRSCSLGAGTFRETVEETLQEMLLDLERHPV